MALRDRFWERFSLAELTPGEWEALCDGCGKCCLHKLEDAGSGQLYYTRVACPLLDLQRCRCSDYSHRRERVPQCRILSPAQPEVLSWMPASCAYRRLAEHQPLPGWHHLLSADPDAVHAAGASVRGKVISADYVHPDGLQEHIVHWVD